MQITIPDFCLVVLIGSSGSGKSTFASRYFLPTEVVSSDVCRGIVSDDQNSLDATNDAFALVHMIAETRLKRRKLTVIDATNVRREDRAHLVQIARKYHALSVAIVLNPGEDICHERNAERPDRQFGPHVVRNQTRSLKQNIRHLDREGFRYVFELRSVEDINAVDIARTPLWTDRRNEHGPFDIIGDVHGCADELITLLGELGYNVELEGDGESRRVISSTPTGRRVIFVGDLVDRGPNSPDVLRIAMHMVAEGHALCVPGNHDEKLLRWLNGRKVRVAHGLEQTIEQLEQEPPAFREEVKAFIKGLVSHVWLEDGHLAIAHAGIREEMIGRSSGAVRQFCLYGETSGETDEFGLPIRYNWAADYRGRTSIIYGHTPVPDAEWLNNTLCIDTGCVFGGKLTALRWPEKEIVSVPAEATHAEPVRPFGHPPVRPGTEGLSAQARHDDLLDLEDVTGRRVIATSLGRTINVHEANAAAALEVMSRFAISPKWLIHLPPTMSPCATSKLENFLEHPAEAFDYYRRESVGKVVIQEKHMGSRALLVVCRDEAAARERFGVTNGETGAVYTRTGRSFFNRPDHEVEVLSRVSAALTASDFWQRFETEWVLLDAEIMPWSAKAQGLIRDQYAATGAAATAALAEVTDLLHVGHANGQDVSAALATFSARKESADKYVEAYRRYCWPVRGISDYRIAPFHILASEGRVHMDKDHLWHMGELGRLTSCEDELLFATPHRVVDLANEHEEQDAIDWWRERVSEGGEGMVVKPLDFIAHGSRGLVQPAVKCRGPEYLRIIYGPEYDVPGNLERLRRRGLGLKRALAMREFALGHEALVRFIDRQPLRRVHECTFAILAMESEPVDPRL